MKPPPDVARRVRLLAARSATVLGWPGEFAAPKATFPRIGGMFISTPPYEVPGYEAQLAKHHGVLNPFAPHLRVGATSLNARVKGNYTVRLTGTKATGSALVELYEIP